MYTSKELSKKIAEAGFKAGSKALWSFNKNDKNKWSLVFPTIMTIKTYSNVLSAYDIIYDICIKYPKQFFGEDEDEYGFYYEQYTQEIFYLLQQGKTQKEIEDYIIKNSILLK